MDDRQKKDSGKKEEEKRKKYEKPQVKKLGTVNELTRFDVSVIVE